MAQFKLLEIGPFPPPASGWSVRIKYVKEAFDKAGHDCLILNLGKFRAVKSGDYIDVQSGFDYLKKLFLLRLRRYHFHMHMNAQAVKGPILSLLALAVSILTFERATLTFHGGIEQLYFPKRNAGKMYWLIYFNLLLAKVVICNNDQIKNEIINYGPFVKPNKIVPIQAFSVQYLQYDSVSLGRDIETFFSIKKHIICCYIVLRNGFFIETLLKFLENMSADIGVILIGIGEVEDRNIAWQYEKLQELQNAKKVLLVGNLNRNEFLTLFKRSNICLRTPVSDGVSSSVLEALYLGTPVVASENNRRPEGVITYEANNHTDLTEKINSVISDYSDIKNNLIQPEIKDTVKDEVHLLVKTYSKHKSLLCRKS